MADFFLDFHGRYHLSPDRSIYETFNRPKEEKTRRIETRCDIPSIAFDSTKLRFRKKRSNYCWCQSKRRPTQNWFAHLRPCQSKRYICHCSTLRIILGELVYWNIEFNRSE